MENTDSLILKWGSLKGYCFLNSPECLVALEEYNKIDEGGKDTPRQKELICIMIDKVNGDVINSWTGEVYQDREDAKRYIIDYETKNYKIGAIKPDN